MKSRIINLSIIILSVFVLVGYVVFVDGVDNIVNIFTTANLLWLLVGAGFMLLYWILEGTILHASVSCFDTHMMFQDTMKTTMIGQFFNCITPSATGGQPMQAYYMNRIGVSVGYSTSALLIRFIVYQLGLTIYSGIVLVFKYQYFASEISNFKYIIIIGFLINTGVATMLLLIGFSEKAARKIMRGIVKFLAKIRILKNLDKRLDAVDKEVSAFHDGFKIIKHHKTRILGMFGLTFAQLTAFFMIPVTICCSFGIKVESIFSMISAASCVQMASAFVPLPGAAGGAELSFFLLFKMFFPQTQLSAAVLLWRLFTFYLPILVGVFFARNLFGKKLQTQPIS